MKYLKRISLAMALVMVMLALTACGGGSEAPVTTKNEDGTLSAEETQALNVYVCAQYVNADAAQELVDKLNESVESLKDGTYKLEVTCVSTGSGEDPSMQMAGMMKLTMALAAQEVDVIIADELNAARNARSDSFYALSDLFTADEIAALGDRALSYELLDDEGNPSGEMGPACGVDVTGDSALVNVVGNAQVGAFVAGNAANLENAKDLMRALISREAAVQRNNA